MEQRNQGSHLVGTFIECDSYRLLWRKGLTGLLTHFPHKIDMRPIEKLNGNPMLGYIENPNNKNDFGYSGLVVLYESHFAFHTWSYYMEVDFDIFSCKEFDFTKALKILQYFFKGRLVNCSLIGRGNYKSKIDIIKG